MLPRVPGGCSRVTAYGWDYSDGSTYEVDALEWWPISPGLEVIEGRRYIVIAESFRHNSLPDFERLETGERRPIPVRGGMKYFNRSRRILALPKALPGAPDFDPWRPRDSRDMETCS